MKDFVILFLKVLGVIAALVAAAGLIFLFLWLMWWGTEQAYDVHRILGLCVFVVFIAFYVSLYVWAANTLDLDF